MNARCFTGVSVFELYVFLRIRGPTALLTLIVIHSLLFTAENHKG